MTTARASRSTAAGHVPWGAMTMLVAILLSVALLVISGLGLPAQAPPMHLPAAPAADGGTSDTERITEPVPAPAPQPALIR